MDKGIFGQNVICGAIKGKQAELFDKNDFKSPEPDLPGQGQLVNAGQKLSNLDTGCPGNEINRNLMKLEL